MKYKTLNLKDVIETLTYYNLEHSRFPHNYMIDNLDVPIIGGMALDDRKLILIDKELPLESGREIVIHELIHTKHYRNGDLPRNINTIERIVQRETEMTYKKLYGHKP